MPQLDPPAPAVVADQEPFWEPIGQLVFAFGHLEEQIEWCITLLLNADSAPKSPSVASQIRNICSRIALVEALYRQLTTDEQLRVALHNLIKELRVVFKFRNGVLHGPWGNYFKHSCTWQKPRTNPVDLSPYNFEVSVEVLQEHIQRAADIGNGLVKLILSVVEEHASRAPA